MKDEKFIQDWMNVELFHLSFIANKNFHPTFSHQHETKKKHLTMAMQYSPADFLERGLKLCGFSDKTIARNGVSINEARFKDKYYVTPTTCAEIFQDMQKYGFDRDEENKKIKPDYLLLALFYLKKYPTKHDMAAFLDCSEATALSKSKSYVKML